MTTLIHLLGADIPHHNRTVLRFFNDKLACVQPAASPREFWVVNCPPELQQDLPALKVTSFASKAALAKAVTAYARRDRSHRFFFHGQFNPRLWLAMLSGALQPHQILWHIWGADLYQDRRGFKFRLFYLLRRWAQRRVDQVFGTVGDLRIFQQYCPHVPGSRLYFPARMPPAPVLAEKRSQPPLTILVGNSGDASNRHIAALQAIYHQFGQQVRVVLPMGYPSDNQAYISEVEAAGRKLFPRENLEIVRENLAFERYIALIAHCDLGYFIFERQQGIGTLCLLIQNNVPLVLSRKNPFWQDLAIEQIPLFFSDMPLTIENVTEGRRQLTSLDKSLITFFDPAFTEGWKAMLTQFEAQRP